MERVSSLTQIEDRSIRIREATSDDVFQIVELFHSVYKGFYPLEFGNNVQVLTGEIADSDHYLWVVAEYAGVLVGAVMFSFDQKHRIGKAGGAVVNREFRRVRLASTMLRQGVEYLTKTLGAVDVLYGTTRTVSEGPSKMVEELGFKKMGLFPNALQLERMEHLNLDIFVTPNALALRRRNPYLYPPFLEVYEIARSTLGLEKAHVVTEREVLSLTRDKLKLQINKDAANVAQKFRLYSDQRRLSNSFFPFHVPNWILESQDGGTEVFIWYGGLGRQASILGYRTDRVDVHDLLDAVALALQTAGAGYVELLVDAYDYVLQQAAYTARYIPSGYFPAMKLSHDGLRDDYFVLSRTFNLLDFTNAVVFGDNFKYLQAYLRCYYELYIQPLLGNVPLGPSRGGVA